MGLTYFKRFRMEIDLRGRDFAHPVLPGDFYFMPWSRAHLEAHAEAKFASFRDEIDSDVFPCLGEYSGCLHLMEEIAAKPGFLPDATWLIASKSSRESIKTIEIHPQQAVNGTSNYVEAIQYCGTVQGVIDRSGMGAIQNLGVVPDYRGRGLGKALMMQALAGFQKAGLSRAFLEVTAQNSGAVQLYKRLGFARSRTVYKVSEVAYV